MQEKSVCVRDGEKDRASEKAVVSAGSLLQHS